MISDYPLIDLPKKHQLLSFYSGNALYQIEAAAIINELVLI